jgi:chromosome segregation ATPase
VSPAPIAPPSEPKQEKPTTQPVVATKPKPKKDPYIEIDEIKKKIFELKTQIVDIPWRKKISYSMGSGIRDMENQLTGWNHAHYKDRLESFFAKRKHKRQLADKKSKKREYDTETASFQMSNDEIKAKIKKLEARKVKLEDETGITAERAAHERQQRQRDAEERAKQYIRKPQPQQKRRDDTTPKRGDDSR